MSVLRAILGRFARLLVRIARTLDPGVAATPYRAAPARMAALRQRYPGAPDHWLELLARRTNLGEEPAGALSARAPTDRRAEERPDFGPTEHVDRMDPPRTAAPPPPPRPAPRFPVPVKQRRAVVHPHRTDRAVRPTAEAPGAATRAVRPVLNFAAARMGNPIVNLLRRRPAAGRPAEPSIIFDQGPPRGDRHAGPEPEPRPQRERHDHFPSLDRHSRRDAEWTPPHESPRPIPDPSQHWPEFRYSAPPGPSWPTPGSPRMRPDPRFAAPDNRWPELPPFLDESTSGGSRASDEAALLAEQMGGKWSA